MIHETIYLRDKDFKLPLCLRGLLIGPSQSGKTTYMIELLKTKDQIFQQKYDVILYCSPNNGFLLDETEDVKKVISEAAKPIDTIFLNEIPNIDKLLEFHKDKQGKSRNVLLLVDDFNNKAFDSPTLNAVFFHLSSHARISALVSCQDPFTSGKYRRSIFKNLNYLVLWDFITDGQTVDFVSRSIYPGKKNFLSKCLKKAKLLGGNRAYIVINAEIDNKINTRFPVMYRNIPSKDKKQFTIYFAHPDSENKLI